MSGSASQKPRYPSKATSLNLTAEEHAKLRAVARAENRSMTGQIRHFVASYLKEHGDVGTAELADANTDEERAA